MDDHDSDTIQLDKDFGDPESLLNSRDWLQGALEKAGAEFTGGGMGMGQADIDIVLDGFEFNVSIKPRIKESDPVRNQESQESKDCGCEELGSECMACEVEE